MMNEQDERLAASARSSGAHASDLQKLVIRRVSQGKFGSYVEAHADWMQSSFTCDLYETQLDPDFPSSRHHETLQQLRDELDSVLVEIAELQRLIDELNGQEARLDVGIYFGDTEHVQPGQAHEIKFQLMSDGLLVRFGDVGGHDAESAETSVVMALQSRLWELINHLVRIMPLQWGAGVGLRAWPAPAGFRSVQLGADTGVPVQETVPDEQPDVVSTDKSDFECLADDWERNRPAGRKHGGYGHAPILPTDHRHGSTSDSMVVGTIRRTSRALVLGS